MKLTRVSNQKSERIQLPYHQGRGFLLFSLSWALLNKRFQRSWMCRRRDLGLVRLGVPFEGEEILVNLLIVDY
ncbi:hypothetical protein AAC387_Pa07g0466 [Persea americana]